MHANTGNKPVNNNVVYPIQADGKYSRGLMNDWWMKGSGMNDSEMRIRSKNED